jgi:hypothetical protein
MYRFATLPIFAFVCLASQSQAQSITGSGATWNGSWGFASTSERSLGLNQAQAQRAARQAPAPGSVTYETVYNNTTNTNTVGAMNTGSTTVTVTGDGNTLTTTSAADSNGCLDGSVGWTTAETGETGPTQDYSFALNDAGTTINCAVGN